MAANVTIYPSVLQKIANGTLILNGTYKLALLSIYVYNASNVFYSNITGEVSGGGTTGYQNGGFNVGLATLTLDVTNGTLSFSHNAAQFTHLNITCNGAILYKDGIDAPNKTLIFHANLTAFNNGTPLSFQDQNFNIAFPGNVSVQGITIAA